MLTSNFVWLFSVAVIENDPSALEMFPQPELNAMLTPPINQNHDIQQQQDTPYVVIVEQPAPKALRFRYECEGRSAGSIPGASSTSDNKTYPTIQVKNYIGRAVVVVSSVTKDFPHK